MTPDAAARALDEDDLIVLEAIDLYSEAVWPELHAAVHLASTWQPRGTNRFFKRGDYHNVAAEITAIKSQIDAESEAAA